MPLPVLTATIIVCEKILQEVDAIVSAIRIADGFLYTPSSDQSTQAIHFAIIGLLKFDPDDVSNHVAQIGLIRPDGERKDIDAPMPLDLSSIPVTTPGSPRSVNLLVQTTMVVKGTGTHSLVLAVDGQEVAKSVFTLTSVEPSEQPPVR